MGHMLFRACFKNNLQHYRGTKLSKDTRFSITSAERYSLALFELSEENNILSKIEDQSSSVLNLINHSQDFLNLIKDPTGSQKDLLIVINKISEIYKFENLFKNFLSFLIKKRRFFFIERILKSFIDICSRKRGELNAELKSAKELSSEEISKITDELTKNFSSKIKLNYKLDESLIGGLVVQVGSTMVDTSIKNKLQQIENRMIEA
jgi:F-type H+-transporting ATPase subunit delta